MKKILGLVLATLISMSAFADAYVYYGYGPDNHIPTCQSIMCPVCRKLRKTGQCDGGVGLRTLKQTGHDDIGYYVEYICNHGHLVRFYYDIDENGNTKNIH